MGLDMFLYKKTMVKEGSDLAALGIQVNRVSKLIVSGPVDNLDAAFGKYTVDEEDGTLWVGNEYKDGTPIPFDAFPPNTTHILERVACWRKANCVHAWFVQTYANGVDECQEIPVPVEAISQLLEISTRILRSRGATRMRLAEKLLPTQEGFFFGSTAYDDGYVYDLKETVKMLSPIPAEIRAAADFTSLIYRASW
jgi:hypothetical protein